MIKFSLQCTPDALCYGDHMVTKLTNIMRNILSKTMTNITTNMLIIMTGSDGMNENRDDQFTSGRVPSLGKSSRPYGAKSLSKIANINTAFYSFFFTSNSDYTNTKTLTCPPPPYHTLPVNSPMPEESAPYRQIMLSLLFFASFPLSLMSLFSSVWLLLSETRQKVLGEFLVGR